MSETASTEPTVEKRPKLSPRKRAQRVRIVQYIILAGVVVLALVFANWPSIISGFFDPALILKALTSGVPQAIYNTVIYTVGGFVLGLALGTLLAIMRLSTIGPYRWIATAYVEFFRGLPAIVVFIGIYLLPSAFSIKIPYDPFGAAWLALGMVGAAYMAETIRAGIQAVPKGQTEAARSLGMPAGTAMRKIVLPQAFRIVLPPLTNELILLVKDSSLIFVFALGLTEYDLTAFGRQMSNAEANLTPLTVAGFCYLLITLPLSILVRRMEARAAKAR